MNVHEQPLNHSARRSLADVVRVSPHPGVPKRKLAAFRILQAERCEGSLRRIPTTIEGEEADLRNATCSACTQLHHRGTRLRNGGTENVMRALFPGTGRDVHSFLRLAQDSNRILGDAISTRILYAAHTHVYTPTHAVSVCGFLPPRNPARDTRRMTRYKGRRLEAHPCGDSSPLRRGRTSVGEPIQTVNGCLP